MGITSDITEVGRAFFFLLRRRCIQSDHRKGQAWSVQGTASRQFVMTEVTSECHGVLRSEDEFVFKEETKRGYMQWWLVSEAQKPDYLIQILLNCLLSDVRQITECVS